MEELSFLEKLQILFDNVIAHPFFLIILMVPMVVMFLERDTTKKEKDVKKIILLIYIIVIAVVLFIGGSTLFDLFDNVVNGFFMTLYFPNFITLFVVIIISAIICLITVFYKKLTKAIRIINFTGFAIVQTLFCLVLVAIQSNDINIYRENALYSNSDVLTLMQLLMGAFLLQIVAVCVITIINRITEMLDERDNVLQDEKQSGNEAIISEEIKEKRANKNIVLEAKLISLEDLKPKENSDNAVLSMDNEVLTLDDSEKAIDKNSLEETNSLQIDENIIEKDDKSEDVLENTEEKSKIKVTEDNLEILDIEPKEMLTDFVKPKEIKDEESTSVASKTAKNTFVNKKIFETEPLKESVFNSKPDLMKPMEVSKNKPIKPGVQKPSVFTEVPTGDLKPNIPVNPVLNKVDIPAKEKVVEKPKVTSKLVEGSPKPNVTDTPKVDPVIMPEVSKSTKVKPKTIEKPQNLRNTVLTISNLRILKTRKTIKDSRHMKYYKKRVFRTKEIHPITNLEIIDFDLMLSVLDKKIKKLHTNRK